LPKLKYGAHDYPVGFAYHAQWRTIFKEMNNLHDTAFRQVSGSLVSALFTFQESNRAKD